MLGKLLSIVFLMFPFGILNQLLLILLNHILHLRPAKDALQQLAPLLPHWFDAGSIHHWQLGWDTSIGTAYMCPVTAWPHLCFAACWALWWASCQIHKIAGAHAPGMPGTFSPSPQVSDPDMHHGTCVTHVPWCMPGSLTSSFLWNRRRGKTFPAFPAHAQTAILGIW